MKATFRSRTGKLSVEVEGENPKVLFERLAEAQEALDADSTCGMCKSPEIRFRVRNAQNFRYYELACDACSATLTFGQRRDGVLFPKRRCRTVAGRATSLGPAAECCT